VKANKKNAIICTLLAGSILASSTPVMAESEAVGAYAPLRFMAEQTGGKVDWLEDSFTAVWSQGDITAEFPIGSKEIKWNGQTVRMEEPVKLVKEKTMIPSSFAEKWLGITEDPSGKISLNETGIARSLAAELQKGPEGKALELVSKALSGFLPQAVVATLWDGAERQLGDLKPTSLPPVVTENAVHRSVSLTYAGANGVMELTIRLDKEGKVDDFQWFLPNHAEASYRPAKYDNPENYVTKEVSLGQDPWELPGTLTLPRGEGPFPAVVLVHGSGPNDRDSSMLGLKPFRDLAAGLASEGIAVLRYEKRTREHNLKSAFSPLMTINEETVIDAGEAVKLLAGQPEIDPKRIYVAGHSLGAMMLPRIHAEDKEGHIAGSIVMAGPATPLEDLLVYQYSYLEEQGMVPKGQAAAIKQQVDLLKAKDFDPAKPDTTFTLGSPYYWQDLKGTYAAEEARKMEGPIFIVQGGRDYQVPVEHLELWRKALADRSDVEFRTYPKMNHMLVNGEGTPLPTEYANPGNVVPELIQDLAKWIKSKAL